MRQALTHTPASGGCFSGLLRQLLGKDLSRTSHQRGRTEAILKHSDRRFLLFSVCKGSSLELERVSSEKD